MCISINNMYPIKNEKPRHKCQGISQIVKVNPWINPFIQAFGLKDHSIRMIRSS